MVGLLCLGCYSAVKAQAGWFSFRQEARFVPTSIATVRHVPDTPEPSTRATLRSAASAEEAWGRIEVERLGLRAFIAEGVDSRTLQVAVGHVPTSAFPDEGGNVALAGHRDSFFRPLSGLVSGDVVTLVTLRGAFNYQVESIEIVTPDRIDVIAPRAENVLTLVTCYPFDVLGHAPLRFIARARLID